MKGEKTFDELAEAVALKAEVPYWKIERPLDDLISWYADKLISNYCEGAGFDNFERHAGCEVAGIGEGEGYVVITKSRKRAVKAILKFAVNSEGGDSWELEEGDLKESSIWTYKKPEEEGGDYEFYFDLKSKHPEARKGFYYYV